MSDVTFILTSYNYEKYIPETIESIINQSVKDWNLIIVDDGSKDNSLSIINKFVEIDSRIILLTHENNQNLGLIKSLQLGIKNSKSKYIVFLESDDKLSNNYLEKKLEIFNKFPNVGLIYNQIKTFGEKPNKKLQKTLEDIDKCWKFDENPQRISDLFYFKNHIPTFSCVMVKKEFLEKCQWNSPNNREIDWWLWAQISAMTDFYYIKEKLTFWRIHKESYMSRTTSHPINTLYFLHCIYNILPPISSNRLKFKIFLKYFCILLKYSFLSVIKCKKLFVDK